MPEVGNAHENVTPTAPVATDSRTVKKLFVVAAVLLLVVAALFAVKRLAGGLPLLTPPDLAAAQELWSRTAPASYDLTVELAGRQTGLIRITVRDGKATSMTRNGADIKQERSWQPWTVPGMFETLEIDFDNRDHAQEKFGVDFESIHMRCEFDQEYGYPKRYLHQIYGRHQDLEWTVVDFTPKSH